MKKILCAALLALCVAACSKEEGAVMPEVKQKATVTLNVSPYGVETKNSGNQNSENLQFDSIRILEIFVFREDGALELYNRSYTGDPGGVKTKNIQLTLTQGKKYIYAVANSKSSPWTGITTKSKFLEQEVSLKSENFCNVTMTASYEITLTNNATIELYLQKLMAKIRVRSIATKFSNGPYREQVLKNVRLYLINAVGKKTYLGDDPSTPVILNAGGYVSADNSATAMSNIISEDVQGDINDSGHNTEHCFYCYENILSEETGTKKFTRLVLEAQLDGHTYYYPVDINQPSSGWTSSINHRGVKRNTVYSLSFLISGPGADSPDDKVLQSSLSINTYVIGWSSGVTYTASF